MKKSLAIVTSFLLLSPVIDSVAITTVHAEAQAPVLDAVNQTANPVSEENQTTNPVPQDNGNQPFFYDLPLPEVMNQYIPGDIKDHWASTYLLHFIYGGILKGYEVSPGKYEIKPDNEITRAEFITLLIRTLGLTSDNPGKSFEDVPEDQWFYESISIASANGIVNGVDEQHFAPDRNVQRDEMAVMIIRAFKGTLNESGSLQTFMDVPSDWWAKPEIDEAVKANIINGYEDNTFRPEASAKRAEAVKMLFTALVGQNSNLPTDEDLSNTVINMDKELLSALQSHDFTLAGQIIEKYDIGYNQVMGNYELSLYQEVLNKEDNDLNFHTIGEYKVDILAKSNSIATVQLSNITHQIVKVKDGTVITEYTEPVNNIIYLRKMPDGQWKAYYNMPDVSF